MPDLIFTHPRIDDTLTVTTGADQIQWSYGLNHVTYPTYGGEVVQILSCYIDDITIEGTVGNYLAMERIYSWFLEYVQIASQGTGEAKYRDEPVTCSYPERGWIFKIKPYQLPGYRLATELVAPTWKIVARVVEPDGGMTSLTMANASQSLRDFGHMNAGIGYVEDNPFSDPFPKKRGTGLKQAQEDALQKVGDYFSSLIPAYAGGDVSSLFGSGPPAYLNIDRTGPSDAKQTTGRKGKR